MEEALKSPMLYLSLYFKTNYKEYIEKLQNVREFRDWEGGLKFFLKGIYDISERAFNKSLAILELFEEDIKRIDYIPRSKTLMLIQNQLRLNPISSIKDLSEKIDVSVPAITKSLRHLEKMGIVNELTGYNRNRLFGYSRYLNLLSEGTDPLKYRK